MAKKPTTFSMRMPEDLNEKIQSYATEHNCTKAEAMSHFARAGIELEENGPAVVPSASEDSQMEALKGIQERLDALNNLPTIEPATSTAIVPVDIKDKIQTYSAEHNCSEHEALTYYARIGIQMTSEQRAATASDVAELSRRIDLLAKDNQAKTDQMNKMVEMLTSIQDYTRPDELELEGELAEQEAEDVVPPELTEEERQRIADEHTRKIVSDVMGDYMAKQRDEALARESERAASQAGQTNSVNVWIPVLVAVIVSLVIGIVVILTR
ncbi:MAG: hypothetical protein Q4A07_12880 [Coriobacteriales bacterium]|nr:hypothetical protein [Coriobacteriales bacterium]